MTKTCFSAGTPPVVVVDVPVADPAGVVAEPSGSPVVAQPATNSERIRSIAASDECRRNIPLATRRNAPSPPCCPCVTPCVTPCAPTSLVTLVFPSRSASCFIPTRRIRFPHPSHLSSWAPPHRQPLSPFTHPPIAHPAVETCPNRPNLSYPGAASCRGIVTPGRASVSLPFSRCSCVSISTVTCSFSAVTRRSTYGLSNDGYGTYGKYGKYG